MAECLEVDPAELLTPPIFPPQVGGRGVVVGLGWGLTESVG